MDHSSSGPIICRRVIDNQQRQLQRIVWLAAAERAEPDHAPANLPGQQRGWQRLAFLRFAKGGCQRRLDDGRGQFGKLLEHDWQRLRADKLAVSNPQQVAAALDGKSQPRKVRSKLFRAVNQVLAAKKQPAVADFKLLFEGSEVKKGKKPKEAAAPGAAKK